MHLVSAKIPFATGGVAQLGERMNGIHEVKSSILSVSTKTKTTPKGVVFGIFANKKVASLDRNWSAEKENKAFGKVVNKLSDFRKPKKFSRLLFKCMLQLNKYLTMTRLTCKLPEFNKCDAYVSTMLRRN